MIPNSPKAIELKTELDKLIQSASNSEFDILETIYHNNLQIYMFDEEGNLNISDKPQFIKHVSESTTGVEKPNTWAKYHQVEADDKQGHILISRKVNLTGVERKVTLSIDFVFEEDRWQISREVIFVHKNS